MPEFSIHPECTASDLSDDARRAGFGLIHEFVLGGQEVQGMAQRELPNDLITQHDLPYDHVGVIVDNRPNFEGNAPETWIVTGRDLGPPWVAPDGQIHDVPAHEVKAVCIQKGQMSEALDLEPGFTVTVEAGARIKVAGDSITEKVDAPHLSLEEVTKIFDAVRAARQAEQPSE